MMKLIRVDPKWLSGRTPSGSGATRFRPSGLRQRSRRGTGDPRADLQILNHEVFVTFEGRSGWHVGQRDDDFVGDDQLGGLGPLGGAGPLLTRLTRRPGGMFKGTRRDDRPGLEPLETEDFVFELLDA